MNNVEFDFKAAPNAKLFEYLFKSKAFPVLANSLNCSSADTFPPPKV